MTELRLEVLLEFSVCPGDSPIGEGWIEASCRIGMVRRRPDWPEVKRTRCLVLSALMSPAPSSSSIRRGGRCQPRHAIADGWP